MAHLIGDMVESIKNFEELVRLAIVLVELLSYVRTDIAKPLLDGLGHL